MINWEIPSFFPFQTVLVVQQKLVGFNPFEKYAQVKFHHLPSTTTFNNKNFPKNQRMDPPIKEVSLNL